MIDKDILTGDDLCEIQVVDAALVRRVRAGLLPERAAQRLAATFAMLADPTRLKIVQALDQAELCVCDLAAATGLNRTTVSHQLRLLRGERLVKYRKEGRMAYYSLDDEHIATLLHMGLEHVGEELGGERRPERVAAHGR